MSVLTTEETHNKKVAIQRTVAVLVLLVKLSTLGYQAYST